MMLAKSVANFPKRKMLILNRMGRRPVPDGTAFLRTRATEGDKRRSCCDFWQDPCRDSPQPSDPGRNPWRDGQARLAVAPTGAAVARSRAHEREAAMMSVAQ